ARIICGGRKTEIAEFIAKVTEQLTRLRNCLERIERVLEAVQSRGFRHELGHALSAFWADGVRLEVAFLPDQAREKINGQIIAGRRRGEGAAQVRCRRGRVRLRRGILNSRMAVVR